MHNADIHFKEDCVVEDLIDIIEGSRIYIPAIYVLNKIDQITTEVGGLRVSKVCRSCMLALAVHQGRSRFCRGCMQGSLSPCTAVADCPNT